MNSFKKVTRKDDYKSDEEKNGKMWATQNIRESSPTLRLSAVRSRHTDSGRWMLLTDISYWAPDVLKKKMIKIKMYNS